MCEHALERQGQRRRPLWRCYELSTNRPHYAAEAAWCGGVKVDRRILDTLSRRRRRQSEETSRGCKPRLFKPVDFFTIRDSDGLWRFQVLERFALRVLDSSTIQMFEFMASREQLFVVQRDHRVSIHGALGGNVARDGSNERDNYSLSLVTILSGCEINNFAEQSAKSVCYNLVAMFDLFRLWLGAVLRLFRTRRSLMLENLALRQQLAVFKRQQPRPTLGAIDKLFWVVARRFWAHWKKALLIVLPDTVARWHRSGFKLYWAMLCTVRNPVGGGRRISQQIRELIFQMVADNPSWGAPRIHGELLMLDFDVSETTISRWMKRAPKDPQPAKRWLAFLRNHREAIGAMDFFTVPTLTFGVLYCFFIIGHDRRRILHFNVTRHPTSIWIVQQLREAFPYDSAPRFLLLDHDAKYGLEVPASMRSLEKGTVICQQRVGGLHHRYDWAA